MDTMPDNNDFAFFESVAQIIEQAQKYVGRTADLTMCVTYFEVGRMIVEEEQGGKARAAYGKQLLAGLSRYLNKRVGKGFSESTLKNARKFYQVYSSSIRHSLLTKSEKKEASQKSQTMLNKLANNAFDSIRQALLAESYPFTLSWSHSMKNTLRWTW